MKKKSKELTQSKKQEIIQEVVSEKNIKEAVLDGLHYTHDTRQDVNKICKRLNKAIAKNDTKEIDKLNKELNEIGPQIQRMYTLETKSHLALTVDDRDIAAVLQMTKELEEEYDVKTPSERALVQLAVNAFFRMMRSSSLYNSNAFPSGYSASHERAHFLSVWGKEADRSQRQYLSAIQALKESKMPPMKVNIKSNTAFVAGNQQNIANPQNNDQQ